MQLLRKIFFYIFVAIYVVSCPLIILYAFGYLYRPGERKSMIRTGLVYVQTMPQGASVYVNGGLWKEKTPADVQGLTPGEYEIRIELEGYRDWIETVPVEAEKATVLDNILLSPGVRKLEKLLQGPIASITPLPGTGFLLVSKAGEGTDGPVVYDRGKGEKWPLFAEGFEQLAGGTVLETFVVWNSPDVVLRIKDGGKEKFIWVGITEGNTVVRDVTALFPEGAERIDWLSSDPENVFSFHGGVIDRVDLKAGAVYPGYAEGVRGYGVFGGYIYLVNEDRTFGKLDIGNRQRTALMGDPALGKTIFGAAGFIRVIVLTDDIMFFLDDNGKLSSNRLPYVLVDKGAKNIRYCAGTKTVLVWTDKEIGVIVLSEEKTGDVEFEKGLEVRWVYGEGRDIEQCFWAYDGTHILFRDGGECSLLGAGEYARQEPEDVVKTAGKVPVYYSERSGELFFVKDDDGGALFSTVIVPERGFMPGNPTPGKGQAGARRTGAGT